MVFLRSRKQDPLLRPIVENGHVISRGFRDIRLSGRRLFYFGLIAASSALFRAGVYLSAPDAQILKSRLAEIKALDQEGRFDQAIRAYRELLLRDPGSKQVRLDLANDLARTGKCEDLGTPDAERGSAAERAQQIVAGVCYFRRNEISSALQQLRSPRDLASNDTQAAIFLARAYSVEGEPAEGLTVLRSLKPAAQDDADVLYWTGALYDELAEQTYDAMAKSHPDSYEVLETQGDQLLQQQKYDGALQSYQRALTVAPGAPGLHFDLGNTYWRMARLDEAAVELSRELKTNPADGQAYFELGDIAVKQGNFDKGRLLLRKALDLDAALVEAHRSLGRAYLAEHDYAEAVREFIVVSKAQPSDHTIHALLASVYQRMGRHKEAEEESQRYNQLVKQQMNELQQREAEQNRDAQTNQPGP